MPPFRREAVLEWSGDVVHGSGRVAVGSGAFTVAATVPRLAGEPAGATTPEELLAASHATCFGIGLRSALARLDADGLEAAARAAEDACTISDALRATVPVSVHVRPASSASAGD